MIPRSFRAIIAILLCISITSCSDVSVPFFSTTYGTDDEDKETSAARLYNAGRKNIIRKQYKSAIENFHEIERLYPFSKLATKAKVMTAFANYKDGEYDDALLVINRFVKLNPGNADIAYMYYLKALCYYVRIADVKHDQKITEDALTSLVAVSKRYPESKYARDALLKVDLVRDHLAGKEMEIGRFYIKQKKYIAGINRFSTVVKNYQTTTHIEEALYRLVEANLSIGLVDEAKRNAAVLGHNYPSSNWYKYAYRLVEFGEDSPVPVEEDDSWIGGMIEKIKL